MNTLLINASIQTNASITRQLANQLASQLAEKGSVIVERDLGTMTFITQDSFAAVGTPVAERSPEQQALARLADELIAELQVADTLILGAPVYNFGPPAALKAWADLVARAGTTFRYTAQGPEGLLKGKKAYILAASGGTGMGSDIDFMSPWLRQFLGFIGISDVDMVAVEAGSRDGAEKLAKAKADVTALTRI